MRNPGRQAAGCAAFWNDRSGSGIPAFWDRLPDGLRFGDLVRFSAALATRENFFVRPAFCTGGGLGVAAAGVWGLQRGSAVGVYSRAVCGDFCVGNAAGEMVASPVCRFLENCGKNVAASAASGEKFFEKSENFVCICGKMGYNKVE